MTYKIKFCTVKQQKHYKMSADEFMFAEIGIAKKFFQKTHLLKTDFTYLYPCLHNRKPKK